MLLIRRNNELVKVHRGYPLSLLSLVLGDLTRMTPGRWDGTHAAKDESNICLTCPMASVFLASAKVAEISYPSIEKTAVVAGMDSLLSLAGSVRAILCCPIAK